MEMYYLLIAMWTYSAAVIPEKYTKDDCENAGKATNKFYICVPAPKTIHDTLTPIDKRFPLIFNCVGRECTIKE